MNGMWRPQRRWRGCARGAQASLVMLDAMEAEMADQDAGRVPDTPMAAEVRDRLVCLIAAELGAAWDAAVATGADPATLAEIVDERRRRIEGAAPTATDEGR